MQNVIIDKPYQFIPAHRGNGWPSIIQRLRLIDIYLKRCHGVHSYEVRDGHYIERSLEQGHGIVLAPNHCRPGDPIVLGWLARELKTHVFAMASWHLYHQSRFTAWAMRRMGAFSVYREGIDRQALDTAIDVLVHAERPLIVFPEGSVTRTNDKLHALLDGVAFIARAAAKKRKRLDGGKVVIHPVALKYIFQGDLHRVVDDVLTEIETRLSWRPQPRRPLMTRIRHVGFALLTLKELEFFGAPRNGTLAERLQGLIDRLLHPIEEEYFGMSQSGAVIPRIKNIRMKILPDIVRGKVDENEKQRRWHQLEDVYLAQQVYSYPPDYLNDSPSVDRLLETVERYEEDLTDSVRVHGDLHVVIQAAPAIEVSTRRTRGEVADPVMGQLEQHLQKMLDGLALESSIWTEQESLEPGLAEQRQAPLPQA